MARLTSSIRAAIVECLAKGMSIRQIQKEVKCAKKTVELWVKRWKNEKSIEVKPNKPPRKRAFNNDQEDDLVEHAKKNKYSSFKQIVIDKKYSCTPETVSRYLKKRGLRSRIAAEQPELEPKHVKQRLTYCEENLNRDWSDTFFTDEKTLQNHKSGRTRIIRAKGERFKRSNIIFTNKQSRCKVNLWSWISKEGLGELYWISNKFDSTKYRATLEDALPKMNQINPNFVLQQDNARHHTSKETRSYLNNDQSRVRNSKTRKTITVPPNSLKKTITLLKNYPARSPDLNIIENVWSILQHKYDQMVLTLGQPSNAATLFEYAKTCWSEIQADKELVPKLFASLSQRVRKVVHNKGFPIHA